MSSDDSETLAHRKALAHQKQQAMAHQRGLAHQQQRAIHQQALSHQQAKEKWENIRAEIESKKKLQMEEEARIFGNKPDLMALLEKSRTGYREIKFSYRELTEENIPLPAKSAERLDKLTSRLEELESNYDDLLMSRLKERQSKLKELKSITLASHPDLWISRMEELIESGKGDPPELWEKLDNHPDQREKFKAPGTMARLFQRANPIRVPAGTWRAPVVYRAFATGLGASMWFFLFYRAKQDGAALLGLKHPWDH